MQLRAPTILVAFWTAILLAMWLVGCGIPVTLRVESVPPPDETKWQQLVVDKLWELERRIEILEQQQHGGDCDGR